MYLFEFYVFFECGEFGDLMEVRLDCIGNKCSDVYQSEARQGWNYILFVGSNEMRSFRSSL